MVSQIVLQREGRRRRLRQAKSIIRPVPPPVGGWNTRDALASMDETDAVNLDNWFPDVGKVSMRNGHEPFATGLVGNVDTLAEYHAGTLRKFLAAANTKWFDITTGTPTELATGNLSDRWETVNFNGQLHAANGQDAPISYDGTTISNPAWTGTGLTVSTLNGVNVFKNRLFFTQKNSQDFWYADINAIAGTLRKFPLSRIGNLGGNIVGMKTWTLDAGDGVDDLAVFIMSSGQVAVYAGTDPGDSAAWSIQGIYNIGAPVDIRGFVRFAGDLLIVANDDYHSLSQVLQLGGARTSQTESKISGAARDAVRTFASNVGWQAIHYPKGNMVFVNVPTASTSFVQHVRNTITGAWCRFKGLNGRSWGIFNDNLYFGGTGTVFKADTGTDDNSMDIVADAQTAWTNLGSPSNKKMNMVRPIMGAAGTLNIARAIGVDFKDIPVPTTSSSAASGTPWGSPWSSPWSPASRIRSNWLGVAGQGEHISLQLKVASQGQRIDWFRTDFLYEQGFGL